MGRSDQRPAAVRHMNPQITTIENTVRALRTEGWTTIGPYPFARGLVHAETEPLTTGPRMGSEGFRFLPVFYSAGTSTRVISSCPSPRVLT